MSVFFCFSVILWTIFIIVVACILITYLAVYLGFVKGKFLSNFLTTPGVIVDLRVLALNCWGMPGNTVHLSEDKELRMKHIGDMISKVRTHYLHCIHVLLSTLQAEYDVYLLSELWMRPDHETIRLRLPPGKNRHNP